MATTDHPESVHDDVGTPVEVQARDEQMISGEVHGVEPDVRRASEERTLRVVMQVEVQEQRQQTPFQRITVMSEAVRDVMHVIGGSRGAEAGAR